MHHQTAHFIRNLVVACSVAIAAAASGWFWMLHENILIKQSRISQTVLDLEHATGYTGFIHDFKNAVLRPDEPHYIHRAIADYDAAIAAIDALEEFARSEGMLVNLDMFRDTLWVYRTNLDVLASDTFDPAQIAQTDLMVRVDDEAARRSLDFATRYLLRGVEAKITPLRQALVASLAVLLVLLTLLVRELHFAARTREEHAQLASQKRMLETERAHRQELAKSLDRLQQANREQAEFTYAISHDLKSPTNTANMLLEALREEMSPKLNADEAELLEDLDSVIVRMSGMITDMIQYTRSLDTELPHALVSLDDIAQEVQLDLRADIHQAQAQLSFGPLPSLMANPSQMRNLMQNLVQNAIKFNRPGTPSVVHIRQAPAPDGQVAYVVEDNGIGIPKDKIGQVFKLFGRLHQRDEYDGTGLGLPICLRIARNHGGDIHVDSTPGKGSKFTVTMKAS